jgi:hypothetical protein
MPQPAAVLAPKRYQVLSGSVLKAIAVVSMLIDHIAAHLLEVDPQMTTVLFDAGTIHVSWYFILRTIGRLAFPIFCFLLAEGFRHTRDRRRYGLRLLLFALLSEIPFDLFRGGQLLYTGQNVFFTLLLGYLGLWALEAFRGKPWRTLGSVLGLFAVSWFLHADYSWMGFLFILVLYLLGGQPVVQALAGSALLPWPVGVGLAFLPLNLYDGRRGFIRSPWLKLGFYAFYPLHLLLLWQLRLRLFGY